MTNDIRCSLGGVAEQEPVVIQYYPDGMPRIVSAARTADRILLRPKCLADFVAAMFWIDALKWRGHATPHLLLPFIPGARQDRINVTGDYLFTAKSIAQMINARCFPSVTVLDPHSEVTPALIDRCRVVYAADVISPPAGKYAGVISPDAGAEKRAGAVARKLGVPLIHAWKNRDVTTGAISGFGFDSGLLKLCGARVLVVDDICDGGGTFIGLAGAIKAEVGDQFDLHIWTTHGIYSRGVEPLKAHYSHIYCTDSIPGERPGVIEVGVCQRLLGGTL